MRSELRLPPLRPLLQLLLAFLLPLPTSLAAQEAQVDAAPASARAHLEVGARLTSLRSQGALLLGGSARLDVGGPFTFGGGGWVLNGAVDTASDGEPGSGLRLRMSYGGLLTGTELAELGPLRGFARLLVGAGNAKVQLPVVETEIASDNFLVLEPSVGASLGLGASMGVVGEMSYRWTMGVEDLPGVAGKEIRGLSLTLGWVLGPS